ncbi:MAG: hypothetical protein QNJ97_24810 [Myxococcota bacterium]|nr:hypothetical protein [Myxococcota bacterium]
MIQSPSSADLSAVWGTSINNIWVLGKHGVVFHYDGDTWSVPVYGISESLNCIDGLTANSVWIGGSDSDEVKIYHLNDSQWVQIETGFTGSLESLWITEPDSVWLTGKEIGTAGGLIQHYDGTRWTQIETELRTVFGAWGSSNHTIFFVG